MNDKVPKYLIDKNKKTTFFILGTLLSACNGGGKSTSPNNDSASVVTPVVPAVPTITTLTGAVIKGPAQDMIVGVDIDGDGSVDGATTLTSGTGGYSISSSNPNATIIAVSGPNTIDTSSGQPLLGVTLKAPPLTQEERDSGMQVAVTPVSTIMEASPDIEPAQLAIAMGIPSTAADGTPIDIRTFNPFAEGADPVAALAAEKAAQQVMATVQAVKSAAEGAGMSVEAAFEQAMSSVAEVVSVEAEKVDVSSTESIAAAEASMADNKVDFSNSETLAAVTTAVKAGVTEAAEADASIVVNEEAFAATLETAVTAVANVVKAIEVLEDFKSEDSMATFATLTDLATEIKAAAVAEVEVPGSGAELVTLVDESALTAAVEVAKVEVAAYVEEVVEAAAAEAVVPGIGEAVVVADDNVEIKDDSEGEEAIVGGAAFIGAGAGAGAGAAIVESRYISLSLSSNSPSEVVMDVFVDINSLRKNTVLTDLAAFNINITPELGWNNSVEAMSGNVAFNWTNAVTYSASEGVLSVNNSFDDDAPGSIVLLSGIDLSGGQLVGSVKIGSISYDPNDSFTAGSFYNTGEFSDTSGSLVSDSSILTLVY